MKKEHWDGGEYRRVAFPQKQINSAYLKNFKWFGHEHVLDIGCGDGTTTIEIAKQVPQGRVLGIDASPSMIDAALLIQDVPNLHFELRNAQDIAFEDQFDVATSFFCMQWVPDKKGTFQKIATALKARGQFLMIATLPHPHLPEIRKELLATEQWKSYFSNYLDPLRFIVDHQYKQYTQEANLKVIQYNAVPAPISFQNYRSFFDFMAQMTPHLSCLPEATLKETFMHDLLAKYVQIYPQKIDGSYELTYALAQLHAFKEA